MKNLTEACGKKYEDFKDVSIFEERTGEFKKMLKAIEKILNTLIESSNIGFILYHRYEDEVFAKF